jgi:hypothetical protein
VAIPGVVAAVTGLTALLAPPNTTDSMTYHMARVAHWVQNHSVAHYPTHIVRQLYQAPWAEYAIMHLQILSRGDRLANLVQYGAFIGSAVGASLVAEQVGADRRGQLLAALLVATIPMGILQASSTQNDYVVTLWLVSLAHFALSFGARPAWASAAGVGASLGLAALTKGTAYVYAPALLCLVAPAVARGRRWRPIAQILAAVVLALALNLGYFARNVGLEGSPIVTAPFGFANEAFGVKTLVSNLVRNAALHLGTPVRWLNERIEQDIRLGLRAMGVKPDDVHTTWVGTGFAVRASSTQEDRAGNLVHLVLVVGAVGACLLQKELRRHRILLGYLAALVAASCLFALALKWQPWHSRLHLPLFVLFSPVVAVALARTVGGKGTVAIGLGLALVSLPFLLQNRDRPLITRRNVFSTPRKEQYFLHRPVRGQTYEGAARAVRASGCRDVGLLATEGDWEYPLWVRLGALRTRRRTVRIEHVDVRTTSAVIERLPRYAAFSPCVVVALDGRDTPEVVVKGAVYDRQWFLGRLSVYTRR